MSKYRGVVTWSELEGGFWQLVCEDGSEMLLDGGDDKLRRQGLRVEIEGRVDHDAMGFAMTGPTLRVSTYRVVG